MNFESEFDLLCDNLLTLYLLFSCARMLARRREAEISIDLMKETYRRIVEEEESRKGLLITRSFYGRWLDLSQRDLTDAITDVTIPLQCLVKDSKLILHDASKVTMVP